MSVPSVRGERPPASLYVHFPFCVQRCHYCDFSVDAVRRAPVDEWLSAIVVDLGQWFDAAGWTAPIRLDTIFLGGGTPSLLDGRGIESVAGVLCTWFAWDETVEWTVEANPSSLSREGCERWKAVGVNRLSIGVQSFDDAALRWLGRLHDAEEALSALRRARRSGFHNISIDLMFGLPAAIERDWLREVRVASEQGVTHVSAYGLSAEPGTPLGRSVRTGETTMADDQRYGREYLTAANLLASAGLEPYEVSNFARPGYECRHNWHYWDGSPYLGIGPSAHSFLGRTRIWNVRAWQAYRKRSSEGGSLREGGERLSAEEARAERVWLGLRTRRGLPLDDPVWSAEDGLGSTAEEWIGEGWGCRQGDRLILTPCGWLRLDALAASLLAQAPAEVRGAEDSEREA